MKHSAFASRALALAPTLVAFLFSATSHAIEPAGSMNVARSAHVAAALADGRALVAGGYTASGLGASAEIFNPATGTFTTVAPLATPRAQAAAVPLADGRVMVIGGVGPNPAGSTLPLASTEIFDPATGTWSPGGSMSLGRRTPVAVALPNNSVLVIGNPSEPGCELYDVASATFTATACTATARNDPAVAVLADGRVLVAGGWVTGSDNGLTSAEIRDFATGTWSPTGSLTATRALVGTVVLANGKVLIPGGSAGYSGYGGRASSDLYDPATGTFTATGSLANARSRHTVTLLGDGNVLVAGGISNAGESPLASIEHYDVALGTWRLVAPMALERWRHTATLLADGDVLLAGGAGWSSHTALAELVATACVATAPSISPASASFTPTGGTGTLTVTHVAGCSWKITNNFTTWLTVTSGAPGVGSGVISYSVAANPDAFPRSVTFRIEGVPHTVTQTADVCGGTALSTGALNFGSGGGTSSVAVTAPAACTWSVTGAPAWITAPSGGTGNTTITIAAASNAGGARNATLSIANKSLFVGQFANPCATPPPTISPTSRNVGSGATTTTVAITTSSGCSWSNSGYPSWITMVQVGNGSATVNINVAANPDATERSATFPVAGIPFTLTQAANFCATASISPTSQSVANTGGTGSIAVTAHPSCPWSVAGVPSWLTITSGGSGSGDGTVAYSAVANSGAARSATFTVAGRSFSVSQSNGPCYPQPTISQTSGSFTATGTSLNSPGSGTNSVNVTAPAGCAWNVAQVPAWVTITSALPGTGSSVLTYTVAPNTGAARSATFNIAGAAQGYTVSQSAPGAATAPAATRMALARQSPAVTPLADGRVLVAGGYPASGSLTSTASVEIYDPATGAFSATGSLTVPRADFAAVLLGNGRVLAIGGLGATRHASAEIYDPATGTWSPTGSMSTPRRYPLAVLLADGRVLVTSGDTGSIPYLTSSEIYDPATGAFTPTGSTVAVRSKAAAALLGDGRVLLAGGSDPSGANFFATAETWDPATGLWTATASMAAARDNFTATPLLDGRVLVAGGYVGNGGFLATAEIYDPATNAFSAAGNLLIPRSNHVATALADGSVALVGGYYLVGNVTPSIERYNPATGAWLLGGTLSDKRAYHGAARLANGGVFIAGGIPGAGGVPGPMASAEIFDPAVCAAPATLSPASASIAGGGGSASVSVTMAAGCPRVVSGAPSWVTITAGASGNGSGTVSYTVAANAGAARSATLVIGGAAHTVSQAVAPPASYCASRGTTSSYEWIQQVAIAGQVRASGSNTGYADFTANTPIALSRSGNTYTLTPGFSSGSYTEYWRIWIDFNGDAFFSDSEIVASGAGSTSISSSFTIPASATAGSKRMRISMKYGAAPAACGSFTYGEVEDYTVTIP